MSKPRGWNHDQPRGLDYDKASSSKGPAQMAKAEAIWDANTPSGLKEALHPDAVEYDVDKTMAARNQVLSDKSVIGNKLANDLNKVSGTIDLAVSVAKKGGVVGMVVGPVIGTVSEVANLNKNATTAEQITTGIVGAVKTLDNATVGGATGFAVGLSTSLSYTGAVVDGTTMGVAAEETYTETGLDKQFDDSIDNSVTPNFQNGIEAGLDAVESAVEIGSNVVNDNQDAVTGYYNDWFGGDNGKARP